MEWSDRAEQTPNTPSVQMFVSLDAAPAQLLAEGLEERISATPNAPGWSHTASAQLGLRLLLPAEDRSNTVTTAFLPSGVRVDEFIEAMDAQGYVLYPGKGPLLELNCFQVANMGWILPDDCRRLLQVMKSTLHTRGAGGAAARSGDRIG